MIIFPAIDLMGGQVVRLQQGKAEAKTIYADDPIAVALEWKNQGAEWLHIVDLDGAFEGTPKNFEVVALIVQAVGIPCQLGGGMRDAETMQRAFDAGVSRVVIGSRACDSIDFVKQAAQRFGGERIAVGIDAKHGKVAVKGWTKESAWKVFDLAKAVVKAGAGTIIYTDIATDGMLRGPNISAIKTLKETVPAQLIASGGVSSLEDIRNLAKIPDLYGVIVGKALYDKKMTLTECLSCLR
ncbi:MAG: 1-(5-phosphoribosyl)-5-[(5-phosphoribosylamino)methylideneamino]imidazole-4-carboxamide isomerase [bacterium]